MKLIIVFSLLFLAHNIAFAREELTPGIYNSCLKYFTAHRASIEEDLVTFCQKFESDMVVGSVDEGQINLPKFKLTGLDRTRIETCTRSNRSYRECEKQVFAERESSFKSFLEDQCSKSPQLKACARQQIRQKERVTSPVRPSVS